MKKNNEDNPTTQNFNTHEKFTEILKEKIKSENRKKN
jgi:hypothetical protein